VAELNIGRLVFSTETIFSFRYKMRF